MAAFMKSPYSNGIRYPDILLHELLLKKAEEDPERVALINGATDECLTYGQMITSVQQMGGALCRTGVKKGDVVCVCATNSPKTVVTMLGILQAGAVVMGMNPTFTEDEMVRQLDDSKAVIMITTPDIVPKVKMAEKRYTSLKHIFTIGECHGYTSYDDLLNMEVSSRDWAVDMHPEDLAMLPYSSGTTGAPKGVMLTHRNLASMTQILNHPDVAFFRSKQRILSVFPLYHVGGFVINMINALYALSSIVYLPHYTFPKYLQALQKYKIQLTCVPPPILLLLDKSPEVPKYDLSHLKYIAVGAAPISEHVTREVVRKHGVQFRQCYGMTETSCLTHVTPKGMTNMRTAGYSLPNIECKIINPADGNTVNFQEEGELLVRGPTTMKGYLNRPDATAETLTEDGWMHTGDIGYMTSDGLLYIVDRLKEVIKYKGYQVAPAELESVILSHPDVADAAVVGVPDEAAGELPRGYVVLKEGHYVEPMEIEKYVKEHVAPYKQLRGKVHLVKFIPKTATGKILRRFIRDKAREEQNRKSKL